MARLVFYMDERNEFKEAYEKTLTYKEAKIICKKLNRHYKLNGFLEFTDRVGGGKCSRYGRIILRWQTNFGILCHEFSHLYEFRKYNESHHRKRLRRIMKTITNYCKKKNYWSEELNKRTEVKIEIEPTKSELQNEKILRTEQNIIRCEKRLKYFNKLYTTKIKRYRRSLSMLKRHLEVKEITVPLCT